MQKVLTAAVAAGLAATTLFAGTATAQVPRRPAPVVRAARVSAQDEKWMKSNAQTDEAEITIGAIALKRAEFPETKMLARVTRRNHKTALRKLVRLAKKLDVLLPATPNAAQIKAAAKLEKVSRSRFDRTYDLIQIAGHVLSIKQTKTEIRKGLNVSVVKFARYYLPIAQSHLRMTKRALAHLPK